MIKKILLDTNFLLIPAKFNVDIFSEIERICHFNYELCILDRSVEELEKIKNTKKDKNSIYAKLALALLKNKKIKVIKMKSAENVDDLILGLDGYIVATQDKELADKLKEKEVALIALRQKKYLILK